MQAASDRLVRRLAGAAVLLLGLVALALSAAAAHAATVVVAPGETLSGIAARTGTSVAALARANGIADPDLIVAGRRLALPGGGSSRAPARVGSYRVLPGDTIGGIAARHGVSVAALARMNGIADADLIVAGRRLSVPGAGPSAAPATGGASPAGSYRVRAGDNLSAIAARHGMSVTALAALNGIGDPDRIAAGQVLAIRSASPATSAPAPRVGGSIAGLLHASAARHGVDPALARAVAWQESRWSQSAISSAGAIGVMQLMPATASWLGPAVLGRRIDPHRLEDNIDGGVAYLGWLMRQAGDTRTAIAAYYQGINSLRRRGPYDDTRDYVASVLSFMGRV